MVKNPPATWETQVQSLGWEDALECYPLLDSCLENSMVRQPYSPWRHKS